MNEAVPLNAAEKRNALLGAIPPLIVSHEGAVSSEETALDNKRYRHFELATKFLYINEKGHLTDTKKVYLDEFVKAHRADADERVAKALVSRAEPVETDGEHIHDDDDLLRSVGTVVLYYFLFFDARENGWIDDIDRDALVAFEAARADNRQLA